MAVEPLSQVAQWRDLLQALDHVEQWFSRWRKDGTLRSQRFEEIARVLAHRKQLWEKQFDDRQPVRERERDQRGHPYFQPVG